MKCPTIKTDSALSRTRNCYAKNKHNTCKSSVIQSTQFALALGWMAGQRQQSDHLHIHPRVFYPHCIDVLFLEYRIRNYGNNLTLVDDECLHRYTTQLRMQITSARVCGSISTCHMPIIIWGDAQLLELKVLILVAI